MNSFCSGFVYPAKRAEDGDPGAIWCETVPSSVPYHGHLPPFLFVVIGGGDSDFKGFFIEKYREWVTERNLLAHSPDGHQT